MVAKKDKPAGKVVARNKRASFDYEILERYEAGIVLTGPEVKSVKDGHIQLKGAYVSLSSKGELWLKNAYISPYKPAAGAQQNYEPSRERKLLVHKRELKRMIGKRQEAGLTFVPISVYIKRRFVKVEVGLARGKRKFEKRDAIKKRELDREMRSRMHEQQ